MPMNMSYDILGLKDMTQKPHTKIKIFVINSNRWICAEFLTNKLISVSAGSTFDKTIFLRLFAIWRLFHIFLFQASIASASDSYGAAQSPVIAPSSASDSYGAAQSPVIAPSSASDSYGAAQSPVIAPSSASDSYGAAQSPVIAPSSSSDSYGAAQGPVLSPSLALTSSSSEGADTYGTALGPIVSSGASEAVILENDDVRNVQTSNEIALIQSTLQQVSVYKVNGVNLKNNLNLETWHENSNY